MRVVIANRGGTSLEMKQPAPSIHTKNGLLLRGVILHVSLLLIWKYCPIFLSLRSTDCFKEACDPAGDSLPAAHLATSPGAYVNELIFSLSSGLRGV